MNDLVIWTEGSGIGPLPKAYSAVVGNIQITIFWNFNQKSREADDYGYLYTLTSLHPSLKGRQMHFGGLTPEEAKAKSIRHALSYPFGHSGAIGGVVGAEHPLNLDHGTDRLEREAWDLFVKERPHGHWVYNEKEYVKAQKKWLKHSGVKVGDEVLVDRLPDEKEGPWAGGSSGSGKEYLFDKCVVTSIKPNAIYVENPFTQDESVGFPYFVLSKYQFTIGFQRRVATVCSLYENGRRIARNITLLNPREKEDNTARAREISTARLLKELKEHKVSGKVLDILAEQAKVVPLEGLAFSHVGLEKTYFNWVVVNEKGMFREHTLASTKKDCIETFMKTWEKPSTWAGFRRKGFSCIKVESYIRRVQ